VFYIAEHSSEKEIRSIGITRWTGIWLWLDSLGTIRQGLCIRRCAFLVRAFCGRVFSKYKAGPKLRRVRAQFDKAVRVLSQNGREYGST
jgi:hypothetical protein